MAINPTYTHDSVLSKVKIGGSTYYFKDLDLRGIVNNFGNATAKDVAASIAEDGTGLATSAQVYTFVNEAVADLEGAMHFVGVEESLPATGENGDVVVVGTKEYIYSNGQWKEIGDEGLWVPNTRTIAGVDLQDNVTKSELQSALDLAALAYKSSASVTVNDYATSITGASYTPAGSVTATVDETDASATLTRGNYTPTGDVTITAGTAAAASYDKTTGVTVASAAVAEGQTANYTPAGSVSITNITVTPSTGTASHVTNSGTGYTITDGNAVKGADTKSAFATEGVVAAIDATDSEMLVFSAAGTAQAVTAAGDVTYTAPVLSGALPTFENVSVATGIQSASGTASFSGTGTIISATPVNTSTAAVVTQPTFTAAFDGDEETGLKVTGVSYKKTTVSDFDFEGTAATITPTLNKGDKTITVS